MEKNILWKILNCCCIGHYSSEADLLKQFQNLGSYNLWFNDEVIIELDFNTDPEDICIFWDVKKITSKPA